MNRGNAQRCVLRRGAGYLFPGLLLNEGSSVQACDRVHAGGIKDFIATGFWRVALMGQLPPLAAEEALPVERPAIEQEKQAQDSPTSLLRTAHVKMIAPERQRGERR